LFTVSCARATPGRYTLSLHDALPISERASLSADQAKAWAEDEEGVSMRLANVLTELGKLAEAEQVYADLLKSQPGNTAARASLRSEEHTSELQSRENLVCRLLLEKKK